MNGTVASRGGAGNWVTQGMSAAGRGVALTGLTLAALGLWVALVVGVTLAALGPGVLVIPGTLRALRRLENTVRRRCAQWCGVSIAIPYLPEPASWDDPAGRPHFWRRLGFLLADEATWRDLLWTVVDMLIGWILTLAAASLLAWGLFGVVMPAVWHPIVAAGGNNWYAFIHVTSTQTAWLAVPLGVAFGALGLWAGPWLLRQYGALAHSMLAPTRRAELALRVSHLARTRTETIDASAAEVARIERDLHDGAQARLVAMGMTLDAAGQLLDESPEAARALLLEARDASVKALAELRNLVRGIHPPVLADRGLAAAVQALALEAPLRVRVAATLPGRPEPPVESAAYFAVSELLANVSKHAHAAQAWIDLRYDGGRLRIDVGDDGPGGADPAGGSGLAGIERRLAAFDGVLALSSPPGGPTVVSLEIPCALSSPKTSTF